MPQTKQNLRLHTDVLFSILLRLPPLKLQEFKPVCREWVDIINEPSFAEAHLARSNWFGVVYSSHSLIYFTDTASKTSSSSPAQQQRVDLPPGMPNVSSSCRGLLLLACGCRWKNLCVANPVTMRCRRLPPIHVDHFRCCCGKDDDPAGAAAGQGDLYFRVVNAGMGFVPRTREYKAAAVCRQGKVTSNITCYVLTLGSGPWREVPVPFPVVGLNLAVQPVPVGTTTLHWRASTFILSLDLDAERFHQTTVPFCDRVDDLCKLLAWEKRLAVAMGLDGCRFGDRYEIWTLDDDCHRHRHRRSNGGWEKLATIDRDSFLVVSVEDKLPYFPIASLEDGRVVILYKSRGAVLSIDPRRRQVTKEIHVERDAHGTCYTFSLSLCQLPGQA